MQITEHVNHPGTPPAGRPLPTPVGHVPVMHLKTSRIWEAAQCTYS